MAAQAELGCSLTTWLQRGGRVCLPAGVSPGEEEEGLHHGALVSLPLLLWGLSRGCGARRGSRGWYVEPSSSLRGSGTNYLVLVGKPRPVPAWCVFWEGRGLGALGSSAGQQGSPEWERPSRAVSPSSLPQGTEVHDLRGEAVRAPHQELLRSGRPAPPVSPHPSPPSRAQRGLEPTLPHCPTGRAAWTEATPHLPRCFSKQKFGFPALAGPPESLGPVSAV